MSPIICMGMTAAAILLAGPRYSTGNYLPKMGPAPLRFQAPDRAAEVVVMLPPLAMTDPEPPLEFYGPPPPLADTNAPIVLNAQASAQPEPEPAPDSSARPNGQDAFSPQMLVQFFNQNGTNSPTSVIVPMPFNPPPPRALVVPSSTVRYTKQ